MNVTEKKHASAIKTLYKEHGVGRTVKQRLAYWNSTGQFCFSHNPTDGQMVAIHEQCWLMDEFPQDFSFH